MYYNNNNNKLVNEFYSQLLKVLASNEVSILDEKSAEGVRNFALNNTKLFIKKQVVSFKCDVCDHELNIADLNGLEGASCINFRCNVHYHLLLKDEAENYYRQVYNRSRSPRIYATEHTGLLERADREMKEFQFLGETEKSAIQNSIFHIGNPSSRK